MWFTGASTIRVGDCNGHYYDGTYAFNTNQWYQVAVTVNSGSNPTETYYVNGTQVSQGTSTTWTSATGWGTYYIGYDGSSHVQFNGVLDENRLSNTVRSAGWIATEYNNQNSPSTFSAVGTLENAPAGSAPNMQSLSPANGATGVSPLTQLTITFDKAATANSAWGNTITIKKVSDNSVWDTIQACDTSYVSGPGTATITIQPHHYLMSGLAYYVEIGSQCFANGSNYYAGFSGSGTWSFTITSNIYFAKTSASVAGCLTLTSDGKVSAWGDNSRGGYGDGTTNPCNTTGTMVKDVSGSGYLSNVVDIASGGYYNGTSYYNTSYALKSDGTVYAWGNNDSGQLGINSSDTNAHSLPVQVLGVGGSGNLSGIIAIRSGTGSDCVALKSDGTVYAWGYNNDGELGDGTTTQRNAPVQVLGVSGSGNLSNVVKLAMDIHGKSFVALKRDGTVYDWGINDCHQQMGAISFSATPVQVSTYLDRTPIESSWLIYLGDGTHFVIPVIMH